MYRILTQNLRGIGQTDKKLQENEVGYVGIFPELIKSSLKVAS
jgi:hypothetical protein